MLPRRNPLWFLPLSLVGSTVTLFPLFVSLSHPRPAPLLSLSFLPLSLTHTLSLPHTRCLSPSRCYLSFVASLFISFIPLYCVYPLPLSPLPLSLRQSHCPFLVASVYLSVWLACFPLSLVGLPELSPSFLSSSLSLTPPPLSLSLSPPPPHLSLWLASYAPRALSLFLFCLLATLTSCMSISFPTFPHSFCLSP